DVAGEYLLMAATLLEMKSKMLLPAREVVPDEEFDEYEGEDPREALIRRLVEYRKYKIVAGELQQLEAKWQLVFSKPPVQLDRAQADGLRDGSVYDMISALQKLLKRKRLTVPRKTRIQRE